jgi:hypothetical protein
VTALVVIDTKTGQLARFLDRRRTHKMRLSEDGGKTIVLGGDERFLTIIEQFRTEPDVVCPEEAA